MHNKLFVKRFKQICTILIANACFHLIIVSVWRLRLFQLCKYEPLKKIDQEYKIKYEYLCVIDPAWGQDGWILAEYFAFLWSETKFRSLK